MTLERPQTGNAAATDSPEGASTLGGTLLRAAWLSILLGFVMEALLLLLVTGFGNVPRIKPVLADLVQKVSWSVFVCVGIAVGTAASKARAPVMGFMGLLAAPSAFTIARFLHKSASQALAIAGPVASAPSPIALGLLKGVEYGCLGTAVGWVGRRPWGGAAAYLAVGLCAGIVFGGAILALTAWAAAKPLSIVDLLARGINEVLFPVGCSIVLYTAETLGKRASRLA